MWTTIAVVALLLIATVWVTRINTRHEEKQKAAPADPDALVAAAWDDFGIAEDPEQVAAAFDAIARRAPAGRIADKTSLARLAVMAVRAGRYEALDDYAARAEELDGGCGETAALGVLAAAYGEDAPRAREMYARSQRVMAGCASCGAGQDVKILLQEVAIAMKGIEDGALGGGDDGAPPARDAGGHRALAARARDLSGPRDGDAELGAPEQSLERADVWADKEPRNADAWVAKGVALARMGSLEVAERALGRALELDAQCFPAHLALAALGSARKLPAAPAPRAGDRAATLLADLVEGWAALSPVEKRALESQSSALGDALSALAESGARVTVAPVHRTARDLGLSGSALDEVLVYGAEVFDAEGVYASDRRVVLRWDAIADPASLAAARGLAAAAAFALPERARAELAAAVREAGGRATPPAVAEEFADAYVARLERALGAGDGEPSGAGDRAVDAAVERIVTA